MVTGTSIGALNGALVVQGDYDFAVDMWENMNYEAVMTNVKAEDFTTLDGTRKAFRTALREIVADGGMEIGRLEELVRSRLDEEKIRQSPKEFGIVTVEIPSLKASEMAKEDIPQGQMADYLLASAACYPAFKRRTIDNKSYVDGGYRDNLPIDLAIELGANEIWAVDLQALGHVPQKLMYDIPVRYIRSYWDLGMFITFDPALHPPQYGELGYLDTMKTLGLLDGFAYSFREGQMARICDRFLEGSERAMKALTTAENPLTAPAAAALETAAVRGTQMGCPAAQFGEGQPDASGGAGSRSCRDLDPACIYTAERFNEEVIRRFSEEDSHQPGEMEQALRRVHENPSTASEIFGRFKSMTGRERLHIVTHLVYGALSGSVPMPAAQLAGAAFPREMSAAIYLWLLGCSTDTGEGAAAPSGPGIGGTRTHETDPDSVRIAPSRQYPPAGRGHGGGGRGRALRPAP